MKIEELRIGNSVLFNNCIDTISELGQANNGFCEKNGYFNFDKFTVEPIELTEEWLIKFGFEKSGYDYWNHQTTYFELRDHETGEYCNSINCGEYDNGENIKYVHQLQNLYFALTGEELETK